MIPKAQLRDMPLYVPGKPIEEVKRELGLTQVVKLASNENPYGTSPHVQKALQEEMAQLAVYPDAASHKLREQLCQLYRLEADQLVFGNGSDEVIQLITRAYLSHNTSTVMATPTFSIYKANADVEGARSIEVPLKDGVHDLERMLEALEEHTRVVWLCNPNNPTGTYVNQEAFDTFMSRVPSSVLVVVDEAYYEYVTAADFPDTVNLLQRYPNLIILRTFSKIYGLASLRIGYGLAHRSVIEMLEKVRLPFNTSRFAQAAALAAVKDQGFVTFCRQENLDEMNKLIDFCQEYSLYYYPSQANFLLINTLLPAQEVFESFLKQGLIIRSGKAFGYETSIRVTIGTEQQMQHFKNVFKQILEGINHAS